MVQNNLPISVIIPYHNESKTIDQTLERVLSQTHPPCELIMVNSSSTDNSSEIVDQWISSHQNERGITFRNVFKGSNTPSSSKNVGVRESKQEWLAFMDCGLIFPPNWLESMWKFLENNPQEIVSAVGVFRGVGVIDRCAIAQTYGYARMRPTVPSTVLKKKLFYRIGFFEENRRAGYDAVWQRSIAVQKIDRGINEEIVFKYDGTSFGSSLKFIYNKMIRYSQPTVGLPHYRIPSLYLFSFIIFIFTLLVSPVLAAQFFGTYLIIRGWVIPLLKSNSFRLISEEPLSIICLPIVGLVIDLGRMRGILKGYFNLFKNKNWRLLNKA